MSQSNRRREGALCSFCRKSYQHVGPLVEGPADVYICGECVELCQSIIDQERRRAPGRAQGGATPTREGVLAALDRFIRVQAGAKESLVDAVFGDPRRPPIEWPRGVLLFGTSAAARLLLSKALARALEVPFALVSAEQLARAEISREDWLTHRILEASDYDLEGASRSVVLVEGMDDPDSQRTLPLGLQGTLGHPMGEPLRFDLSRSRLLCGGAFSRLNEVVTPAVSDADRTIANEVLIACGVIPELAARLVAAVKVEPLDEETLARIVASVDIGRAFGQGPQAVGRPQPLNG
jgi:ATP-dependent Clp protease ATP-binding subunit ClpX